MLRKNTKLVLYRLNGNGHHNKSASAFKYGFCYTAVFFPSYMTEPCEAQNLHLASKSWPKKVQYSLIAFKSKLFWHYKHGIVATLYPFSQNFMSFFSFSAALRARDEIKHKILPMLFGYLYYITWCTFFQCLLFFIYYAVSVEFL